MSVVRRLTELAAVLLLAAGAAVTGPAQAQPAQAQPTQAQPTQAQPTTWSSTLADVPNAARLGDFGAGVTVAVLDTWIDQTHPEFGGRVLAGADCASSTCTPLSGSSAPADGCEPHGTHVAGIIASNDYGIAPAATLLPVRVLASSNGGCQASPTAVANGIRYAVSAGAQVINVSLGGDSGTAAAVAEQQIVQAADDAADAGDLVVFAAGNSGNAVVASNFGTALVVGAVGPSGRLASYSETGSTLLAAGGDTGSAADCSGDANASADCVESTWFCQPAVAGCDPHGLAYDEGTSMAAPQVAGLGALLFAEDPQRGLASVVSAIETTAHPAAGATYGLIDACHAMLVSAPAGSTCGQGPLTTASAAKPAPATRTFVGCPRTVTVRRGHRPTITCRITPRQGGVVIAVQIPKGRSWVTVARVKTSGDGRLRALGPVERKAGRVRLDVGKVSTVVAVKLR